VERGRLCPAGLAGCSSRLSVGRWRRQAGLRWAGQLESSRSRSCFVNDLYRSDGAEQRGQTRQDHQARRGETRQDRIGRVQIAAASSTTFQSRPGPGPPSPPKGARCQVPPRKFRYGSRHEASDGDMGTWGNMGSRTKVTGQGAVCMVSLEWLVWRAGWLATEGRGH
jgi:hypothetical protein